MHRHMYSNVPVDLTDLYLVQVFRNTAASLLEQLLLEQAQQPKTVFFLNYCFKESEFSVKTLSMFLSNFAVYREIRPAFMRTVE